MKVDGEKMKRARISAGLSLRGLARKAGLSHDTVMRIEDGRRSPHPETIAKLAAAMDVPIADLVDWSTVEGIGDDDGDGQEKAAA